MKIFLAFRAEKHEAEELLGVEVTQINATARCRRRHAEERYDADYYVEVWELGGRRLEGIMLTEALNDEVRAKVAAGIL